MFKTEDSTYSPIHAFALLAAVALTSACSSDFVEPVEPDGTTGVNENIEPEVPPTSVPEEAEEIVEVEEINFELRSSPVNDVLIEGDNTGISIPLSITRTDGYDQTVQLQISGVTSDDEAFVTSSFSQLLLTPTDDESEVVLKLAISTAPIQVQQRSFLITATDGVDTDEATITVNVKPTSAPDVYLLAGQSNMIGFSGDGTRDVGPGGEDEPNERVKQLNVSMNNSFDVFTDESTFTSAESNIVDPDIVTALDPLHVPQDANTGAKELDYIGLGLSFGKSALVDTSAEVVLVPAAWSGSAFCYNDNGPVGGWTPVDTGNEDLGNSLLFDRAVFRANEAIERTGGILRGILWHQGESDANERCAPLYADNLQMLVQEFRSQINPIADTSLLRMDDIVVPFVAGTMSRGVDERDDLSEFLPSKQLIDDVTRDVPNSIDTAQVSVHDDLVPSQGYPCGNGSCIHFGPGALREMGSRYYTALKLAIEQ